MNAVTDASTTKAMKRKSFRLCRALASNLDTLITAAKNGDLCLVECKLISTGETVAAICAAHQGDDGTVEVTPFGVMLAGNPYEMLTPPCPSVA
jgi:hypothetical protein